MKKKFLINDDLWLVIEETRDRDSTVYHVIRKNLITDEIEYDTFRAVLASVWVSMLNRYKLELGVFYLNGIIYKTEIPIVYYKAAADICSNNFQLFTVKNYKEAAMRIIAPYGESYEENE